ncbi:MAG TPA: thioesterase family protein [Acidobacteriota bacterium]|nr:thioesterase family protein [Acidobacteriota bacterium]
MTEAQRATVPVEVRYAETDSMGIVHHANYLVWLELSRTKLCADAGHHYADIERTGVRLTVTGTSVRYRQPARYGDIVEVSAWIHRLGSRGMQFAYEVHCNAVLLATGRTDHVWIDAESRPCRAPDDLRAMFARVAGGAE